MKSKKNISTDLKKKLVRVTAINVGAMFLFANACHDKITYQNNSLATQVITNSTNELNLPSVYQGLTDKVKMGTQKTQNSCSSSENNTGIELYEFVNDLSDKRGLHIYAKGNDGNIDLTDEFYSNLNSLLVKHNTVNLILDNLGEDFDLSKVDLSNIESLSFMNCNTKFNYNTTFKHIDDISFYYVDNKLMTQIFSNTDINTHNVYIYIGNMQNSIFDFIDYLVKNNIFVRGLRINSFDSESLTVEILDLLGQLNAFNICLSGDFSEPFNLDLSLNENINSLTLDGCCHNHKSRPYDTPTPINSELGNIKIKSSNPTLSLNFYNFDLTENTHFSLSDGSYVSLEDFSPICISSIKDLDKVGGLFFDPESSDMNYVFYHSNLDYFPERDDIIRNFDEALQNIEEEYGKVKQKNKI